MHIIILLQSASDIKKGERLLLQSASCITKWGKVLLPSVSGIIKRDRLYNKVWQLL